MVLDNPEEIIDLIVCIQGRRMEDQRASLILPEINAPISGKKKRKWVFLKVFGLENWVEFGRDFEFQKLK